MDKTTHINNQSFATTEKDVMIGALMLLTKIGAIDKEEMIKACSTSYHAIWELLNECNVKINNQLSNPK